MEEEIELEVDEEEAQEGGMQRVPMLPSQAEIDEHNITHLPFRRWCPFCLRGRGISSGHFSRKEADESQVPVIAVDYCFLGEAPASFGCERSTDKIRLCTSCA